jgi:hypothetical protein
MLEICALRPSFFPNLASCICALRPTYCIFSQIWVGFMFYALRPTFIKSTPSEMTVCKKPILTWQIRRRVHKPHEKAYHLPKSYLASRHEAEEKTASSNGLTMGGPGNNLDILNRQSSTLRSNTRYVSHSLYTTNWYLSKLKYWECVKMTSFPMSIFFDLIIISSIWKISFSGIK